MNEFKENILKAADRLGIEREIVRYGYKVELLFISECLLSLIIAMIFGKLENALTFILIFTFLREYCGGYHCKGYCSCTVLYIVMVNTSAMIGSLLPIPISKALIYISAAILFIVSPVQNENNRLSIAKRKQYRKTASIRIQLVIFLFLLFLYLKAYETANILCLACLWLTLLCIVQMLISRKEKKQWNTFMT